MQVGSYVKISWSNTTALVQITKIDESSVWGNYIPMEKPILGRWLFSMIKSMELTDERFPEPKTFLSDLKPGDKFELVGYVGVYTYLDNGFVVSTDKYVYRCEDRLHSSDINLEVTLVKE